MSTIKILSSITQSEATFCGNILNCFQFTKNGDPYETFRASEEQFEEYTTSELSYMGRSTDDLSDTFSLF